MFSCSEMWKCIVVGTGTVVSLLCIGLGVFALTRICMLFDVCFPVLKSKCCVGTVCWLGDILVRETV